MMCGATLIFDPSMKPNHCCIGHHVSIVFHITYNLYETIPVGVNATNLLQYFQYNALYVKHSKCKKHTDEELLDQ